MSSEDKYCMVDSYQNNNNVLRAFAYSNLKATSVGGANFIYQAIYNLSPMFGVESWITKEA